MTSETIFWAVTMLVSNIFVSFWVARWAVKGALKQKWWDVKHKAYTDVIDALYDCIDAVEVFAFLYYERSHPREQEVADNYKVARRRLEKMATVGEFVLSGKAVAFLKELRERMPKRTQEDEAIDLYDEEKKIYRETLEGIRRCACRELQR